ncbi:MAG: hypothetical protein HQL95_13100 [Magnetococcales bacterium]|nr:hypothetical protein [Magnetococcales bacterium]
MDQQAITPELRKRMNRAGIIFFVIASILVGFLIHNFTKQYDPAYREMKNKEAAAIKEAASAAKAGKSAPAPSP